MGDRVSNPKFKRGKGTNSPNEKPTCNKCGKGYLGECLVGKGINFSCGKSGHKIRDFSLLLTKGRNGRQVQPSGPGFNAPKQNIFYALQTRQDREGFSNVEIGIFHFYVYALLDPDNILSFVTSYKL